MNYKLLTILLALTLITACKTVSITCAVSIVDFGISCTGEPADCNVCEEATQKDVTQEDVATQLSSTQKNVEILRAASKKGGGGPSEINSTLELPLPTFKFEPCDYETLRPTLKGVC